MSETWTLEIYSWMGMSIGATHFYAEIYTPDHISKGRIFHAITEAEANHVNAKNKRMYNDELVKLYWADPGDAMDGFITRDDAISEAVRQWLEYANDGDVLVDHRTKEVYGRKDG